jgi:hypothetical protein
MAAMEVRPLGLPPAQSAPQGASLQQGFRVQQAAAPLVTPPSQMLPHLVHHPLFQVKGQHQDRVVHLQPMAAVELAPPGA